MAFPNKRHSPRTIARDWRPSKATAGQIDPALLLPEIRAGLYTLEQLLDELGEHEQQLLADAAACYDQLATIAHELDGVRRQLSDATEQAATLREAEYLLVASRAPARPGEHGDSPRSDRLAVQP
ncbi:MAG TPA: hypothetical protein VFV93_03205 [Thermomicrobiales bacterium]|nr:hypothetical protein [Thermomicrobiales bacterium]